MQNHSKHYLPSVSVLLAGVLFSSNASAVTFTWNYGGEQLQFNYNFKADDYSYYKSKSKYEQNMALFAEQDKTHAYLSAFADELRSIAQLHQWQGSQERDMVIRFVQQSIPYKTDPPNHGYDYPRYPIETLYEKRGDCEDKSCLLTALLKTLGYDAVLLEFPGHMATGVAANDIKGTAYKLNNQKYFYVEATNIYEPGKNPGYKSASVQTVNQTAVAGVSEPKQQTETVLVKNTPVKPNAETKTTHIVSIKKPQQQQYYTNASGRTVIKYVTQQYSVKRNPAKSRTTRYVKTKTYTRTTYVMNGKVVGYKYSSN